MMLVKTFMPTSFVGNNINSAHDNSLNNSISVFATPIVLRVGLVYKIPLVRRIAIFHKILLRKLE